MLHVDLESQLGSSHPSCKEKGAQKQAKKGLLRYSLCVPGQWGNAKEGSSQSEITDGQVKTFQGLWRAAANAAESL